MMSLQEYKIEAICYHLFFLFIRMGMKIPMKHNYYIIEEMIDVHRRQFTNQNFEILKRTLPYFYIFMRNDNLKNVRGKRFFFYFLDNHSFSQFFFLIYIEMLVEASLIRVKLFKKFNVVPSKK